MPNWFFLLMSVFFLLIPSRMDHIFFDGVKKSHLLVVLPMMALFGFHESSELFHGFYVTYGGCVIPLIYALYAWCTLKRAAAIRCALGAFLGAISCHMAIYTFGAWADAYFYHEELLRPMVAMVYTLGFCRNATESMITYTLCYLTSSAVGYADQVIFQEAAYVSVGSGLGFTFLIVGAVILFLLYRVMAALQRNKNHTKQAEATASTP